MKNWIYLGIFLDEPSREYIKTHYPVPENWKVYCDHMTVVFNSGTEISRTIAYMNRNNLDKEFNLEVEAVGISERAMALKVKLPIGVICANATPHITIATSPVGKPVDSNNIDRWLSIGEKLTLHGTMKFYIPLK